MSVIYAGESVKPLAPVNLQSALQANGDLVIGWTRRSRQGFAWIDGVDVPLGESSEQYRVTIEGSTGSMQLLVDAPTTTIVAADLAAIGSGTASIEIRQVGDFAASHPVQTSISLS